MEFRLLGPVEIATSTGSVPIGGTKPRTLLAALLLDAGRVVATERLIDLIWDEDPPDSARALIQTYVSGLRRAADAALTAVIVTRPPGYLARIPPGSLDRDSFDQHVTRGRAAAAAGRHQDAVDAFLAAEALWRGSALGGVTGRVLAAEAARLDELRIGATEERLAAELALGQGAGLVAQLSALVGAHPTRERLRGQLMVSLYRAGRSSEALEVYRRGRAALVEELGLEPGPELSRLHEAILRGDPDLIAPVTQPAIVVGGRPQGRFFQRDDGNPHDLSTNYGRLLGRATRSGLQSQIRGILWYQGESDNNDVPAQSEGFKTLLDGWTQDYPGVQHVYVHQLRDGCLTSSGKPQPSSEEREAQRQYEDTLGVTVLSTTGVDGRGPDECHYYYVGGYATLADHDFLSLARDHYGGSPAATTAPSPRAAWFSNAAHTEITIQLRDSDDAITIGCGAADDFLVNGNRVRMVVAAKPGYIALRLESPVSSAAVNISYIGHNGAGPWVANANGIGLLTFYQLPLNPDHTDPFPTPPRCPSV